MTALPSSLPSSRWTVVGPAYTVNGGNLRRYRWERYARTATAARRDVARRREYSARTASYMTALAYVVPCPGDGPERLSERLSAALYSAARYLGGRLGSAVRSLAVRVSS